MSIYISTFLAPQCGRQPNGRRISCKKRESRTAFELRRQLNSHVGRRCAPNNRRRFRRPLNGRAASVQHCFKPQTGSSGLSALKTVLGVILYLKVNLLNLLFLSLYKKLLCYISKFHFPFQHRYTLLKYHFSLLFCTKEMLVPFHFHSYS